MNQIEDRNLVLEQRADPWVYLHSDGYYYFTASVPEYDRIELRRARSLYELKDVKAVTAWVKPDSGPMSDLIWAPELHCIRGKWYLYFAAAKSREIVNGLFDHRMFVLENGSDNPLEGEWIERGQIQTQWDSFALDATVFEHRDVHYLVWAQKDFSIEGNSNLYIAILENPWTIQLPQVMLTKPELNWETKGFLVNEGPAVLKRNGQIFITYSASATDENYCMGMLSASEDADLLNPNAWRKSSSPVFATNEEAGQYGPGHNSFTVDEQGQDVIVYHARTYTDIEGDPLYDPNRHTRAQIFTWTMDKQPYFGKPT
ncbi:family 43 glycosylhydrolase [Exiguobacterium sp. s91]|uniref:glycoside hydrolase family 43 protein n=1 Tax=Exiguobacterium sp. s91 TaxID=2751199 RepID=UPI001BEADC44|nr:family 43 glycosylhydrolase [Exiguobacterium sp. s91]